MQFAYDLASSKVAQKQGSQKCNYDIRARSNHIKPRDHVLIRNVGLLGKQKLADRWKTDVYVVTSQPDKGIPVFEVMPDTGRGKNNILHRNMLLPIGSPSDNPSYDANQPAVMEASTDSSDDDESSLDTQYDSEIDLVSIDGPVTRSRSRASQVPIPAPRLVTRKLSDDNTVMATDSNGDDQGLVDVPVTPVPAPRICTTKPTDKDDISLGHVRSAAFDHSNHGSDTSDNSIQILYRISPSTNTAIFPSGPGNKPNPSIPNSPILSISHPVNRLLSGWKQRSRNMTLT